MSQRTKILIALIVPLLLIAACIPLYSWRWRYCYKQAAHRLVKNAVGEVFNERTNRPVPDQFGVSNAAESDKWGDRLTSYYPPEDDDWNGLDEFERNNIYRIWRHYPNGKSGETHPTNPGVYSHAIYLATFRKALASDHYTPDGQWWIHGSFSDLPAIRSMWFSQQKLGSKHGLDLKNIGFWEKSIEHDDVYYHLIATVDGFYQDIPASSGRTPHELDWATHKHRFENADAFISTSLETIDRLEQRLVELLASDDPMLQGTVPRSNVNVVACTCEFEELPGNRPLTESEKADVLSEARIEFDRRRDLVKKNGAAWIDGLQVVLMPLN